MLRGISAPQWQRWKTYLQLAPSGEDRADLRAALIAQAIWNVQIAKTAKRGSQPAYRALKDFVLRIGDASDVLDPPPAKAKDGGKGAWEIIKTIFLVGAKPKKGADV